ncbi:endonuclease/exonuclease/phosphatase family protein [Chthonomonas calidirosea]|uniref:endonuclease/exonuclease/phosphatase family protein n=1 Tax=Chthonomonas calidirosea TaxID=454171 RepID=UPI0006EC89F7|nr:endonuclease/exonuclease/phosphatase family protein [Chthonomonas calidirosea]CEK14804.1 metal-dependent hydrolase [Chthonomonas calidirosea]
MAIPARPVEWRSYPSAHSQPRIRARRWRRRLTILALLQFLFPALATLLQLYGPERTTFGIVVLYLPSWIWGLPALILLLPMLRYAPRKLGLPIISLLWVAGPLMGFCWHTSISPSHSIPTLRIMTYNVKWERRNPQAIAETIRRFHPDVLVMQDSANILNSPVQEALHGYYTKTLYQCSVASRYPILNARSLSLSPGDPNYHAMQFQIRFDKHLVTIFSVHFLSPRWALLDLIKSHTDVLQEDARHRLAQATGLLKLLPSQEPTIVAGDFNSPPASLVCRILEREGRLQDAFSKAGRGYGYTYGQYLLPPFPFLRIDHIFTSPQWQIYNCQTGDGVGSDHCPVVADLALVS